MSLQTAPTPSLFTEPDTRQAPFYRLYLLQADDHIARRREDYFADDAAAIGAARSVIGDFHGVEIWCGPRKVVTLAREAVALLQQPRKPTRAAILISRNHRLLQQAAAAHQRTRQIITRAAVKRIKRDAMRARRLPLAVLSADGPGAPCDLPITPEVRPARVAVTEAVTSS